MTIKFLEAKNFRSYKDIRVDFSDGVNVIIGENDSGKTNLLRMINWVANNSPSGEDMRSNWGGDTIARLGVDNGEIQVAERFRSNSENLYKIDGQKEPLRAFGQGVPDSIKKILNINDVNIHFQLEGPFLLGKSAPDVAKHYNDAVNLDIIDRSMSSIKKTLGNEKAELKNLKKDQKEQKGKLKVFAWLVKAEKKLIGLEKLQVKKLRLDREYIQLSSLLDDLRKLNTKNDELNEITKHEKAVNDLIELDRLFEIKSQESGDLEELLFKLISLKKQSKELDEILSHEKQVNDLIKQAQKIDKLHLEWNELSILQGQLIELKRKETQYSKILKYEKQVNDLIKLDKTVGIKTDEYNELFDLIEKQDKLNKELGKWDSEIIRLEKEFKEAMPDLCPILSIECKHLKEKKNGKL